MATADLDRVSALLRTYLFEDLSPAEVEPLARAARIRRAVKGEHLWHVGDPADQFYVVVSGQLKDSVVTVDGDEVVQSVYGPGMVIGEAGFFAPERNRVMAGVALEPCTILELRRQQLLPFLLRHPSVMVRLLEGLSSFARGQAEIIAALARRPLPERLLLRLLDLAETNATADGVGVTPRISQATLAAMVGVSRERVNRALAALAAQGCIRIERGRYVLCEPERLRQEVAGGWPLLARLNRRSDPAAGPGV
jgi:CRP-like cAMP-binding protein